MLDGSVKSHDTLTKIILNGSVNRHGTYKSHIKLKCQKTLLLQNPCYMVVSKEVTLLQKPSN